MKVLVHTSGFCALVSSTDENHGRAREAYERLILEEVPLYTSSYVLLETALLIQKRMGYSALRAFLDSVLEVFSVIWVGEKAHRDAWSLMQMHRGQDANLAAYTTAYFAREMDAHVLAFDGLIEGMGLKTLPQ